MRDATFTTPDLLAVQIAADLMAWLRLIGLDQTALASAEPKRLRHRLLHVLARLTRLARQRRLRLRASWPWIDDVVRVFASIAAIPLPP
ncbi:transposase [Nocardioides sp. NPDC006273]|uniref:transposase n=1 Tax=Nocardioides sp. NPDC006273 TaxID=3155598 RepID=UPI0033A8192C